MHSRSSDRTGAYPPAEAASRSGLSLDTLRYYERAGLLPRVARDSGGRRRYSERDLAGLAIIRCLRCTGMSIGDIRRFVQLTEDGATTTTERIAMLEAHDNRIEEQIDKLRADQAYLRQKTAFYRRSSAP